MPPALKPIFASLKHFLLSDSPTDQESRSALQLIYMLCFAGQAALSLILATILAVLSQTSVQEASSEAFLTQQAGSISQIMLFSVMLLLLPSALLVASLWQRQNKNSPASQQALKVASIASTIALAVILAISVWLCVFAYFISLELRPLLLLIALSIFLYFVGFMTTGMYVKTISSTSSTNTA